MFWLSQPWKSCSLAVAPLAKVSCPDGALKSGSWNHVSVVPRTSMVPSLTTEEPVMAVVAPLAPATWICSTTRVPLFTSLKGELV